MFHKILAISIFCYIFLMGILWCFNASIDENTRFGKIIHTIYIHGIALGFLGGVIFLFIKIIEKFVFFFLPFFT